MRWIKGLAVAIAAAVVAFPATALERGSVTNLPLPRYVSLKSDEVNARRGPSKAHRIDWVYTRRDVPVRVVAEYEHWRRVEDRDGAGGWVYHTLLSGVRTVLVQSPMLPLLIRPDPRAPETARLEAGVVARLDECLQDWCRIEVGRYRGWAPKAALWGVEDSELRD
ncbi:SH3 domain-containing protein [Anianabacter salinae]|uniref:SH3 domain-containing protein n=1 Tax=Anianabacter salinae TaxID=2851023 RepID=UPI00225E363E|nr:SH3 domain-containing protein [Anianabacter salinae]MBV0913945.1 aspartyl-trna synthetase [Anianabacter salinae]